MEITRNNYESFFIDFLDNKLSVEKARMIWEFVDQNPDLGEELQVLTLKEIIPENLLFTGKSSLKKNLPLSIPVDQFNFNEYCISSIEKNISSEELDALHQYIDNNPQKKSDLNLFKKTILNPDLSLKYLNKQKLKRKLIDTNNVVRIFYLISTAAAVLLFILMVQQSINKNKTSIDYKISAKSTNRPSSTLITRIMNVHPLNITKNNDWKPKTHFKKLQIQLKNNLKFQKIRDSIMPSNSNIQDLLASYTFLESKKCISLYSSLNEDAEKNTIEINSNKFIQQTKIQEYKFNKEMNAKTGTENFIDRVNKISDGEIKIVKRKQNNRDVISFETRLFSFYQSKDAK